jgi:endonuclease YncB( thermonuclease family)
VRLAARVLACGCLALSWAAWAIDGERITGTVVAVKDGDTLVLQNGRREVDVRLREVDCPERDQPFGARARQATADLTLGKRVTVTASGKDRYGRTLGAVRLVDGRDLGRELVSGGFAWWFRRYSRDRVLAAMEREARAAKRGLWAYPSPVPPWVWRERADAVASRSVSSTRIVPNGVAIVSLLPDPRGRDEGHEWVTIHNATEQDVSLAGWKLRDRAGNEVLLAGIVPRGRHVVVRLRPDTMPLNNDGDEVVLFDQLGTARSRAAYSAAEVRSGRPLQFAR